MSPPFLMRRIKKLLQVMRSWKLLNTLIFSNVLAGAEHRRVLEKNLTTVIDVGANRGQFALAVTKWAPKASIIAFEPLHSAASVFQRVFRGTTGILLHKAAIGPRAGMATVHVSARDDSSSLLPILPSQERLFPGTGVVRTEQVEIGPLSYYVTPEDIVPPAILKLDVQGYELEALRGCESLLDRFTYVYVECSFVELYAGQPLADEIVAWLGDRGWRLDDVYNMAHDRSGSRIQADFLFRNSSTVFAA